MKSRDKTIYEKYKKFIQSNSVYQQVPHEYFITIIIFPIWMGEIGYRGKYPMNWMLLMATASNEVFAYVKP